MYRYDFQVDSETLRLPTLKELVGLTFSSLSKNSSTSQLTESTTSNPSIDDTTIAVNDQRDESAEDESVKNRVDVYDRFEGRRESDDSNYLSSESTTNERDILDNDILSSEEIQRRSSTASVSKVETEKGPEKVELPVKILDDTNGEEIAELVLLRVPQSKLSSAALKPILRVKILEHENEQVPREAEQSRKITKVENSPESSSENELSDTSRSTSGRRRKINSSRGGQDAEAATEPSQDRPRSRQRIVKARRRTRPLKAQGHEDEVTKTENDESPRSHGHQVVRKITRRRENPEKIAPDTTTFIPEVSEPISNTLSPTTARESLSLPSTASNLTRGFYITKDIDESWTTLEPMTTEYQSTSFDDSSQEIDFTTQQIGSTTQTPEPTTRDIKVTSQGDETATPQEETEYTTTESEGITVPRTTSIVEDQRPTTSLETATPDYVSTIIDETTSESSVPTTEAPTSNEPAITTFRPRITEKATTPDPTIPMESTTPEFPTTSSEELEQDRAVTKPQETSQDHSESLKTSENNYWRSTTIAKPSNTDVDSKSLSTGSDEHFEARTRIFEAENSTEATKITPDQNEISVTPEMGKFDVETSPVQSSPDQFSKKVEPEAERSSQKTTTNFNARTTTRQGTTNRGGVRFTTTPKSSIPIERSALRNGNQTQKSTSENFVPSTNSATTKSYVSTGRTTRKQETVGSETNSLAPTVAPRRRGNARKSTTISPKITENTRNTSNPRESTSADPSSVTNERKNNVGTSVSDRSTFTTSNYDQAKVARAKNSRGSSRGRPDDWRTTESSETNETGSESVTGGSASSGSTTEAYGETVESSTHAEFSYGTTNLEEETTSSSETSKSFFQVSSESEKLGESLESRTDIIDTSDPTVSHETVPGTTETVHETSLSEEISTNRENDEISSTRSFVSPDASSTTSPEDQPNTTNLSASNDPSANVTSPKFIEETFEPTTNFVQVTESNALSSRSSVSGPETTRSFLSEDSSDETSTKIPATTKIDEETLSIESSASTTVFPASQSTGSTDDPSDKATTLDDETNTLPWTIEPLDKNTEARNSEDTSVTYGVTTSEAKETTFAYKGTSMPWLHVSGNENINVRETTLGNTLEILEATTPSYVKNDSDSLVTNLPVDGQTTEGTEKAIPQEKKNDVTTEANNRKTISDNDIAGKSIYTRAKVDATTRGTNLAEKESFLENVIPSRATWTTANYENSVLSTIAASSSFRAPTGQQETQRPRGRVRFTNFAGISDDANEEHRRPIKQLVVRRRLAKDRQRVTTTTESNLIKTETLPKDKNQKTRFTRVQNVSARQDVEKQNQIDKKDEIAKRTEAKIKNELADRGLNEKTNSSKTTRRRVVVYRGRARSENVATSPKPVTTTTTTLAPTTVPSLEASSGEKADDDKRRRRRKWRKRIVLKRSRLDAEEDDQSIAETGVVGRALIDGHYVEGSPDTGSYIVMPEVVDKSSETEDSTGEASPFKSPGAFLRRPGTLARNDALNRLRSKLPKTLVPAPTLVPSAKIQSVDPTYEMKTEDQSVRAQELAVTLSDPPPSEPSSTTGRSGLRKQGTTRKISTTVAPRIETTGAPKTTAIVRRRQSPRRNNNNLRVVETPVRPRRPAIIDYDYYVDDEIRLVLKPELKDKLFVTKKGGVRCLDQGNFAHPTSCKKFITCARMGNGQVVGTEYTCPDKLSFDPVGGICNWSAGLGCEDKSKT